jgi:hypothetical protein
MKQFNTFASKLRVKTVLCCSAAVFLSACGGNTDMGGAQLSATAASVTTDAGATPVTMAAAMTAAASTAAPSAAVEARGDAAPAVSTETAPAATAAGATGQAPEVTTQAFELTGYDSNPPQAQVAQQDGGAPAQATITQ